MEKQERSQVILFAFPTRRRHLIWIRFWCTIYCYRSKMGSLNSHEFLRQLRLRWQREMLPWAFAHLENSLHRQPLRLDSAIQNVGWRKSLENQIRYWKALKLGLNWIGGLEWDKTYGFENFYKIMHVWVLSRNQCHNDNVGSFQTSETWFYIQPAKQNVDLRLLLKSHFLLILINQQKCL